MSTLRLLFGEPVEDKAGGIVFDECPSFSFFRDIVQFATKYGNALRDTAKWKEQADKEARQAKAREGKKAKLVWHNAEDKQLSTAEQIERDQLSGQVVGKGSRRISQSRRRSLSLRDKSTEKQTLQMSATTTSTTAAVASVSTKRGAVSTSSPSGPALLVSRRPSLIGTAAAAKVNAQKLSETLTQQQKQRAANLALFAKTPSGKIPPSPSASNTSKDQELRPVLSTMRKLFLADDDNITKGPPRVVSTKFGQGKSMGASAVATPSAKVGQFDDDSDEAEGGGGTEEETEVDAGDVFASLASMQQKSTEEIILEFINKQRKSKSSLFISLAIYIDHFNLSCYTKFLLL